MKDRIFKQDDFRLSDWQYTIRHTDVQNFVCGERVFLKSNPELTMIVHSVNKKNITTRWYNIYNEIQLEEFPPESILQYKYVALLTYRRKFFLSLN
jgi:hypothetical protein